MKNLLVSIFITFTILSCMFLVTGAVLCYSCVDCSDPLDTCLATVEVCNDTGYSCSVSDIFNNSQLFLKKSKISPSVSQSLSDPSVNRLY